jgi:hypothetical protein
MLVVGDLQRQGITGIPTLELQSDAERVPQWLVYLDAAPRTQRPSTARGCRPASPPCGSAGLGSASRRYVTWLGA